MNSTGFWKQGSGRRTTVIELIEGELIEMTPIGKRHVACVNRLTKLFFDQEAGQFIVSVQNPLILRDNTDDPT